MKKPLLNHQTRWDMMHGPDTLSSAFNRLYLARIHFCRTLMNELTLILE